MSPKEWYRGGSVGSLCFICNITKTGLNLSVTSDLFPWNTNGNHRKRRIFQKIVWFCCSRNRFLSFFRNFPRTKSSSQMCLTRFDNNPGSKSSFRREILSASVFDHYSQRLSVLENAQIRFLRSPSNFMKSWGTVSSNTAIPYFLARFEDASTPAGFKNNENL